MLRRLPVLVMAALLISCSSGSPASGPARPTPPPSPSPVGPATLIGAPADLLLAGSQAGLAPSGGRDHVSLEQAASEQENQPLALTRYRSWGWVDEATRSWGGTSPHLDEALLLVTRAEGAQLAFSDLVAAKLAGPTSCPGSLAFDECAETKTGLIARADVYLIQLSGSGVDLEAIAAAQLVRLHS